MIQISLERESKDRDACLELLQEFYMRDVLTKEQIRRGFDLVYIDLDDILVDTPHAIEHLFQMVLNVVYKTRLFEEPFFSRIPQILLDLQT